MTGLVFLAVGFTALIAGITLNALIEDIRLVRNWRKEHGR